MTGPPTTVERVHDSVPLPLGTSVYIRVIKISPNATADSSDQIACDFSIIDVDKGSLYDLGTASPMPGSVQYTALSYMWGEAIADRTIILHGKPFPVRKNLWDFLDRARKDHFEGFLWIDALCIDQAKVGERNHQVALMGKIYSHAEGVIVWLGHVCDSIEDAMAAVGRVYAPEKLPLDVVTQHRSGIRRFCELDYWRRAWIVQEYLLARRVEVWSNNIKCEGRNVGWLHAEARRDSPWPIAPEDPPAMKILHYRQERLVRLTSRDHLLGERRADAEFLILVKRFNANISCADARDRVYSLLSLIRPETQRKLSIYPDYTKSTAELFTNVVYSFARLVLNPEMWENLSPFGTAGNSHLELFERTVNYRWRLPRIRLLEVLQCLKTMLCLSENDVAVQSIQRLINDDVSFATISTVPGIQVEGYTVTLQSLYLKFSTERRGLSRIVQLRDLPPRQDG